eukprot:TRINITY_DN8404_c0_g1_i1.p1 TRINITY_DN8404_c0_g1~~TRINITY_DN8404_c0_g1_i1.p1  ORF type:complete len:359 (+),score=74.90 TRINITY_DN8404_c0_g1_i1:89-1165(+)
MGKKPDIKSRSKGDILAYTMDYQTLAKYFHRPINDVAKELGVCSTVLKKICRLNGIQRWPHRKIRSLDKMLQTLKTSSPSAPEEEDQLRREIELVYTKKARILRGPSAQVVNDDAQPVYFDSSPRSPGSEPDDIDGSPEFEAVHKRKRMRGEPRAKPAAVEPQHRLPHHDGAPALAMLALSSMIGANVEPVATVASAASLMAERLANCEHAECVREQPDQRLHEHREHVAQRPSSAPQDVALLPLWRSQSCPMPVQQPPAAILPPFNAFEAELGASGNFVAALLARSSVVPPPSRPTQSCSLRSFSSPPKMPFEQMHSDHIPTCFPMQLQLPALRDWLPMVYSNLPAVEPAWQRGWHP